MLNRSKYAKAVVDCAAVKNKDHHGNVKEEQKTPRCV